MALCVDESKEWFKKLYKNILSHKLKSLSYKDCKDRRVKDLFVDESENLDNYKDFLDKDMKDHQDL